MKTRFVEHLKHSNQQLREQGLYKQERTLTSPQNAVITIASGEKVINLCANNYLGLADHPELIKAGIQGLEEYGFGMASVRFICGTQNVHQELERRLSRFLGMEDTILYSSCFDANGGLFETILSEEDAVISDSLNHASIIDGIRLCKANRHRYANNNMEELEARLIATQNCRFRLIATDGVFSMDGVIANLNKICDLAEKYDALVMVDDSHAVGFMGESGRGTHEYCDVMGRVDMITGTLGKALGGASGGYTSGSKELIAWLRNRSRPYLFSNSLPPVVASVSLRVLELLAGGGELRKRLRENTTYFREGLKKLGFQVLGDDHPIIPVMLGDAKLATITADKLLKEGIYVVGFSYPVVPQGQARIRTQMSAGLERHHLDKALNAFSKVGKELGII